jgi:thiosulfate dehydrogenase [quinone] large subunit
MVGGFLLALSFFLTASWTTRPHYFGADIVFAAAWTPLPVAGDAGLFSTTARLHAAIRRRRQPNSTPDDVKRRILLWGGLITATTAALGGAVVALTRRTTTNPNSPTGSLRSLPSPSVLSTAAESGPFDTNASAPPARHCCCQP